MFTKVVQAQSIKGYRFAGIRIVPDNLFEPLLCCLILPQTAVSAGETKLGFKLVVVRQPFV